MLTQLTHFVVVITALIYFTPTTPFDWHKPTYFVATIISCTLLSSHTYTAYRVAYHFVATIISQPVTPTVYCAYRSYCADTARTEQLRPNQPTAYKFTINTATPLVVCLCRVCIKVQGVVLQDGCREESMRVGQHSIKCMIQEKHTSMMREAN